MCLDNTIGSDLSMFSNNWFAILAILVTALLYTGLYYLGTKKLNFNLIILIALAAGIGVGILFRDNTYFKNNLVYVNLIGTIYIGITAALVAPLISLSIFSSVTSLDSIKRLKSLGLRSVFWLLLNTAIAIALSLGLSILLGVGKNTNLSIAGLNAKKYANIGTKFTDVIVSFFPQNLVKEIEGNQIIPIIIAVLALSVAYISFTNKKKVEPFRQFVEAAKELVFRVIGFIVDLIPFAVLALAANITVTTGNNLSQAASLLQVVVVIFVLCIFHTFIVNGIFVAFIAKLNPFQFFKKIADAQILGFSTQSTIAVLPTTINSLIKKVGVSEEVANFTASLGATIGMPGCAGIWPVVLSVFAVNFLGIPYTPFQYITLGIIALAISFGTAGVSGTAIITATAVFTAAGLPLEVMVLLLPISFLVGMARTPTNVTCAAVSAAIVARQQGTLDDDIFSGKKLRY
jgi:Na+/H+-dicarboxylate symporter